MSFRRGLYSLFLYLILPFVLLKLLWRSRSNPAYRRRIKERLGFVSGVVSNKPDSPVIWLHAVSVGEAIAAKPLIDSLLEKYPTYRVLVTTTTPTGSDCVNSMFADRVAHVYFPYDLPDVIVRFINTIEPRLLIVMETELWPNLYMTCKQRSIPILIANARLSARSTRSYAKIKMLVKETLSCVSVIAVRSESDSARFLILGAKQEQIEIVGNIKFDIQLNEQQITRGTKRKENWGRSRPVWVAASTHQGEDEIILKLYSLLLVEFPELLLVIVPRHPERFDAVHELCLRSNLAEGCYVRHSEERLLENSYQNENVGLILGDSMGELQSWISAADVVFMGGSLTNTGGHNPLEAIALGVPVVSGPYMFNFDDISSELVDNGLMNICDNDDEIKPFVGKWLAVEPSGRQKHKFKLSSKAFVQQHRGVTARLDHLVVKLL